MKSRRRSNSSLEAISISSCRRSASGIAEMISFNSPSYIGWGVFSTKASIYDT